MGRKPPLVDIIWASAFSKADTENPKIRGDLRPGADTGEVHLRDQEGLNKGQLQSSGNLSAQSDSAQPSAIRSPSM